MILGIFFSVSQVCAQPQIERRDIISATLDAIEKRIPTQEVLGDEERQDPSVFKLSSQENNLNFFSDFSIKTPFTDILSIYRSLSLPILCLNDEEIPDLPDNFTLNSEAATEDLDLLSLYSNAESLVKLYLGLHSGYFSGHTIYETSLEGEKNELEFSLKNWWVTGARFVATFPKMRLVFENTGYISTDDESGKMYESNWGADDALTTDTKSDAYLKLLIWDSSLGYIFWHSLYAGYDYEDWNIALGVLGGYRHEYFKYMIYDLYDDIAGVTTTSGPVIKYRVTYNIPYVGLKINLAKTVADWGLSIRVCFSPFVRAKDCDDHYADSKRSFGECRGWAALVGANLFWNIKDSWTLQGGVDYANIRTAGEQTQQYYSGTSAGTETTGIDDNIYSNQVYFWGRINYKF